MGTKTKTGIQTSLINKSQLLVNKCLLSPQFKRCYEEIRERWLAIGKLEDNIRGKIATADDIDLYKSLKQSFEIEVALFKLEWIEYPVWHWSWDNLKIILKEGLANCDLSWGWTYNKDKLDFRVDDGGYMNVRIHPSLLADLPRKEVLYHIDIILALYDSVTDKDRAHKRERTKENLLALQVWDKWKAMYPLNDPESDPMRDFQIIAKNLNVNINTVKSRWYRAFEIVYLDGYRKGMKKYSREKLSADIGGLEQDFIENVSSDVANRDGTFWYEDTSCDVEEKVIKHENDAILQNLLNYIPHEKERISMLTKLSKTTRKTELISIKKNLENKYGKMPHLVKVIFAERRSNLA